MILLTNIVQIRKALNNRFIHENMLKKQSEVLMILAIFTLEDKMKESMTVRHQSTSDRQMPDNLSVQKICSSSGVKTANRNSNTIY